jgi:hypothetical protein
MALAGIAWQNKLPHPGQKAKAEEEEDTILQSTSRA